MIQFTKESLRRRDSGRRAGLTSILVLVAALTPRIATPQDQLPHEMWSDRLVTSLLAIEDVEEREQAARFAVIGLAAGGNAERAKQIAQQYESEELLLLIADAQSVNDELEAAVETANRYKSKRWKNRTLRFIAIRQAQRGDADDALELLSHYPEMTSPDSVRRYIAEALAREERFDEAKAITSKIKEKQYKNEAESAIRELSERGALPLDAIESDYLRGKVSAFALFAGEDDSIRAALQCVRAASEGRVQEFNEFRKKALIRETDSLQLPQSLALMLVAMGERKLGQRREARNTIEMALEINDQELLGVSGWLGVPVFLHLLVQLEFEKDAEQIVKRTLQAEDDLLHLVGKFGIEALGVVYAQRGDCERLEALYQQYSTPEIRLYLACGVVQGIAIASTSDVTRE